jgi:hypothetical protein
MAHVLLEGDEELPRHCVRQHDACDDPLQLTHPQRKVQHELVGAGQDQHAVAEGPEADVLGNAGAQVREPDLPLHRLRRVLFRVHIIVVRHARLSCLAFADGHAVY